MIVSRACWCVLTNANLSAREKFPESPKYCGCECWPGLIVQPGLDSLASDRAQNSKWVLDTDSMPPDSLADPFPEKPNGMHCRTHRRLHVKASLREGSVMADIAGWLDRIEQRVRT
jgi:hypothetical protein